MKGSSKKMIWMGKVMNRLWLTMEMNFDSIVENITIIVLFKVSSLKGAGYNMKVATKTEKNMVKVRIFWKLEINEIICDFWDNFCFGFAKLGTFIDKNGDKYEGEFEKDSFHG